MSPVILAVLVVLVLAVYLQTARFPFIALDDDVYVSANPAVLHGLSWNGVRWALTTFTNDNWHPAVWLSFMLDRSLLGSSPGGFHLVNVLLHVLNTVLVFLLLRSATGSVGRSAFVAAFFGIHPLHVESVAWISARKDVLSTLFWLLTLTSYVRWTRTRSGRSLASALAFFALGLLSKPMLVTVPLTLLLLDFWPLERFRVESVRRLLLEKAPFALLALASASITLFAQQPVIAPTAAQSASLGQRAAVAAVSVAQNLGRTLWPVDLAVLYPFPGAVPAAMVVAASALLLGLSILVVRFRIRAPYLAFGWSWFVVTWLPVSGLVAFGLQATADRFLYVPLLGLFVAITWGLGNLFERRSRLIGLAGALVVGLLAVACHRQVSLWRDSETLFRHTLAVTGDNAIIENNLGFWLMESGRPDEALVHIENALRLEPGFPDAHLNRGKLLTGKGRPQEALESFDRVLRVSPDSGRALYGKGIALAQLGRFDEAVTPLLEAREKNPRHYDTLNNLGVVLFRLSRFTEARAPLEQAIALSPERHEGHNNLGLVMSALGHRDEAIRLFREALRQKPDYGIAERNLRREEALRNREAP